MLHISLKFYTFAPMKEFLMVGIGSFMGGGLRYLVGKGISLWLGAVTFPLATMVVNVVGCFLMGFLWTWLPSASLPPSSRMLLMTGFCGGFTTFSTFVNENYLLMRGGQWLLLLLYSAASFLLGMLAFACGYRLGSR